MIEELKKRLPGLVEGELLSAHTTFKIGGPAKYFFEAKTNDELIAALNAARDLSLPFFLLGGGSNILVADHGFDGLVIKQSNKRFTIVGTTVYAESGAIVADVLNAILEAGLTGWSWAAGLPGSMGGGLRGNAGAYGEGMGDTVVKATIFHDGIVEAWTKEQMAFSYRHSKMKETGAVVIDMTLELKKGDVTADREQVSAYIKRRQDTQPLEFPNAGCVFKNVNLATTPIDREKVIRALELTEEEFIAATKYNKLPVSFIVQHLGLKGRTMGGAQVSDKHGAFVVNIGSARADQVVMLMSDVKMRVRNECGIQLEEEIQLVGF